MRDVWVKARKSVTVGGTSYAAGETFQLPALVAVRLVTNRSVGYTKAPKIDATKIDTQSQRRGRRAATPTDKVSTSVAVTSGPVQTTQPPNVLSDFSEY